MTIKKQILNLISLTYIFNFKPIQNVEIIL